MWITEQELLGPEGFALWVQLVVGLFLELGLEFVPLVAREWGSLDPPAAKHQDLLVLSIAEAFSRADSQLQSKLS